ncbi:MAG: hypothetical protein HY245_04505 [Rhizobiales bacterium]|nr:hypothetical protein [Hyphomicrobiales bacterium]MBI3672679.1 hypothetical protein [Hyphomicrobiales bacterium]
MNLIRVTTVALATLYSTTAFAATVPCEKMLADLREAVKTAKLSDADAAKVKDLQDKGIERCTADDDGHADEFFTAAMKLLGKA